MTTEDDFQRALDAYPNDWQTRLIFADWLQERGDPRSDGYRALGTLRVWPFRWHYPEDRPDIDRWLYHNGQGMHHGRRIPTCHVLPQDWINKVCGRTARTRISLIIDSDIGAEKPVPRSVMEDAAALGFAKLSRKRRKDLLATAPRGT